MAQFLAISSLTAPRQYEMPYMQKRDIITEACIRKTLLLIKRAHLPLDHLHRLALLNIAISHSLPLLNPFLSKLPYNLFQTIINPSNQYYSQSLVPSSSVFICRSEVRAQMQNENSVFWNVAFWAGGWVTGTPDLYPNRKVTQRRRHYQYSILIDKDSILFNNTLLTCYWIKYHLKSP